MNISNYEPKEAPAGLNEVIAQLFKNRVHKKIEVDKSDFASLPMTQLNHLRREYSQMSQRSNYSEHNDQEDKVLLYTSAKVQPSLKRKFINKQLAFAKHLQITKHVQKKYNDYLVNYMHKTNLLLVRDRIPPNLSVLETIDEGDYVSHDNGTDYDRKDYPHYSNVIKLHELPPENTRFVFVNQPQKIRPEELFFQIQDNCVLKLKQVYQFVSILFKKSIRFVKKARIIRSISGPYKQQEAENHDFQTIAHEMQLHFRTIKLLYDILNQFYGFEREMIKGQESKQKASKEIRQSLKEILRVYNSNQAVHIPHGELYISLKELRQLLHAKMIEEMEESD